MASSCRADKRPLVCTSSGKAREYQTSGGGTLDSELGQANIYNNSVIITNNNNHNH